MVVLAVFLRNTSPINSFIYWSYTVGGFMEIKAFRRLGCKVALSALILFLLSYNSSPAFESSF